MDGEEPVDVARRELVEEAGLEAGEWTHLTSAYSSPGILAELIHFYLARDLRTVDRGAFVAEHEEAEMSTAWVPYDDVVAAVHDGRLSDAHLALAVLLKRERFTWAKAAGGAIALLGVAFALGERASVEAPAFDGGALEHGSLAGLEAVDACGQHGLDARWQRRLPVGSLHGDELLEEQRISLGGLHDP